MQLQMEYDVTIKVNSNQVSLDKVGSCKFWLLPKYKVKRLVLTKTMS